MQMWRAYILCLIWSNNPLYFETKTHNNYLYRISNMSCHKTECVHLRPLILVFHHIHPNSRLMLMTNYFGKVM